MANLTSCSDPKIEEAAWVFNWMKEVGGS